MNPSGGTNAVKAVIPWTDPNICSSSVSHSIDISRNAGWVQAGWWKITGFPVRAYCEVQSPITPYPEGYAIQSYAISAASHSYGWTYDSVDKYWDCFVDNVGKMSKPSSFVDFTSGTTIDVQGEPKAKHVQVGKMAPGALLFSGMQYRQATTGSWLTVNVTIHTPIPPYGIAEPSAGKMQVWTNAH